jgi:O-antigen ligase
LLLILVFLLPIPLGSNRPWAWSFFQLAIFSLTIASVYFNIAKVWLGIYAYSRIFYFWLPIIILATIQVISLPYSVVDFLSPNAAEIQKLTDVERYYLSLDVGQSIINLNKLISYFCLFCTTLILIKTEQDIKLLLLTMVASGTFQAIYGSFEILLGLDRSLVFDLKVGAAATGTFVYKNHFANFIMMCAAAGIGLLVTSLQKDRNSSPKDFIRSIATTMLSSKALIRIAIAIMVIGLVMSRSRMGNTAFFLAMTIVGFASLYLIKNKTRGLTILVVSMFIIDLFIVSAYFGLEKVQDRLVNTSLEAESRDEVIKDALPMIFDYPLFGTGGGSFYSTFPKYQSAEIHHFYDHAHNDYIQMVIEYGIISTSIMAGMIAFLLYKAFRVMRRKQHSILKGASFACSMVLIGMLTHMTVDFPLQAYANACYFTIFLALTMIINSIKLNKKRRRTK